MQRATIKEFRIEGTGEKICQVLEQDWRKIKEIQEIKYEREKYIWSFKINQNTLNDTIEKIFQVVEKHAPSLNIQPLEQTANQQIYLTGLGCASCAEKITSETQALPEIKSASLDFVSQKLSFALFAQADYDKTLEKIKNIVAAYEPQVCVMANKPGKKNTDYEHSSKTLLANSILIFGALIFFTTLIFNFSPATEILLFVSAYALIGHDILGRSLKNISRGQIFDENFLMSLATIGAIAIGEYPEAVAVMLFYQIGEYFQHKAVDKARGSISALMDIRPDFAHLKTLSGLQQVAPELVQINELIVVKPGEKIPLDGEIVEGFSSLDTVALTGESLPTDVKPGDEVLSGSINKTGLLTIKVTKPFHESTVAKILDLVENAASQKAPTEKFITKFAKYYTPLVVLAAALLAFLPPLVLGENFQPWIHRALVFLVVSCPCALVISVPLTFFSGIGAASRKGILVKGSNYLEALNNVSTIVFDKTGTLTKGTFSVSKIVPAGGFSSEQLLEYAAYTESSSNHPLAKSIVDSYQQKTDPTLVTQYEELPGLGIKAVIGSKQILAGNEKLLQKENITFQSTETLGSIVYLAVDRKYAGYLEVTDQLKEDSQQAIEQLKELGIKKTVLLTGDRKKVGQKIAHTLKIDEVYSELLPQDKVAIFEQIQSTSQSGHVAFAGDGINDAPVLARSDIGIAMGGIGSDAAIQAADVVIMTDEPSKIATGIKIAQKTRKIVTQNICFSLAVKAVVLVLGGFGIATMWEAVFSDVGVTLLAVLNSMRALKI